VTLDCRSLIHHGSSEPPNFGPLHGASILATASVVLNDLLFTLCLSHVPSSSDPSHLAVAEVAGRSQLSLVSNFILVSLPAYDR
jgi:hypothetical protein